MRPESKYDGEIYLNTYVTDEEWRAFSTIKVIEKAPVKENIPVVTHIEW
jgi:hypothetical protein